MLNVLLDGFPEDYRGYPLNTDFRVGILLTLLVEDSKYDDEIKMLKACDLLYKEKVPDLMTALDGITWFLSCGKSEDYFEDDIEKRSKESSSNTKCIDFNFDSMDIWGAFWGRGVDLSNTKMHWFKFMSALSNLGDCPLTQKISYRSMDTSKLKGESKKYYEELKEKYKVKNIISKEEYEQSLKEKESMFGSYYMKLLGKG